MKRLLSIALVAILLLGVAIPAVSVAETKTGVVHGGWLRLRSAASFDASTITSYYTGTVVTILSTTGSWYEVRTPDGRTGYMYSAYVTVTGSGGGGSGTGTSTVWSSNGYGVRMRSGPGTGYRVLAVYPVGTKVTVLQRGSYWSQIQVGSLRGYMMNQFLTGGSIPETTTGADATVWSSNGYGVRLRTGPSKSYSIIGVYSVGTTVKVLEKGAVWSYIQIGSRTGYMMTEFLIFNPVSKAVTSVTLNYKTPVAGSTLKVASLTPAEASVSYKWVCDGTTVGTGSSLQVKDTWAGKPITLTVTGKDGYTGSASVTTNDVLANGDLIAATLNIDGYDPVVGNVLRVAEVDPKGALYTCEWIITRTNGTVVKKTTDTYTVVDADVGASIDLVLHGKAPFSGDINITVGTGTVQPTGSVTNAEIVNTTNPTILTNVANVNDTLRATYEPAVATVKYEWWVTIGSAAPVMKSTSSTYTVPAGATFVELKVIGTGKYVNTDASATVSVDPTAVTFKSIKLTPDNGTTYPLAGQTITALVMDNASPSADATANATFEWYVGSTKVDGVTGATYPVDITDVGKTIFAIAYGNGSTHAGKITSAKTAVVKAELNSVTIASSSGVVQSGATLVAEVDPEKGAGSYTWYGSNDAGFATKTTLSTKKECFVPVSPVYQYFKVVVKPATNYTCATPGYVEAVVSPGQGVPQPRVAFTPLMAPMTLPEEGATETPPEVEATVPTETEATVPPETETITPTETEITTPTEMPTDTPTEEPSDPPVQDPPAPAVVEATVEPITYSVSLRQEDGKLIASVQPLDLTTTTVQYAWYDGDDRIADEAESKYIIREGDVDKEITVKVKLTVGTDEPIYLSKKIVVN